MAPRDRWHFAGRWYTTTLAGDVADRDGIGLELDDIAPAPGRGLVLEAFRDDAGGTYTLRTFTSDPLPVALVEQFLTEARHRLEPFSAGTP